MQGHYFDMMPVQWLNQNDANSPTPPIELTRWTVFHNWPLVRTLPVLLESLIPKVYTELIIENNSSGVALM